MPVDIGLVDDGALLMGVLPSGEYEEEHLPHAINIPLRHLTAESVAHIDRATPVVGSTAGTRFET